MSESVSTLKEKLIIRRFRELSEDGKRKLIYYAESLYQEEKTILETEFPFSEQEKQSLDYLVKDVQEFSGEEISTEAQKALQDLCQGIFESKECIADNHDFFLYGAPKRKQ